MSGRNYLNLLKKTRLLMSRYYNNNDYDSRYRYAYTILPIHDSHYFLLNYTSVIKKREFMALLAIRRRLLEPRFVAVLLLIVEILEQRRP